MPVVFVEVGGVARSGHEYGDRTGVEYEFPTRRYARLIQTGDRFVYQKPGLGYTGCGVVGVIRPSGTPGRSICDVEAVRLFETPVALADSAGSYYEADTTFWKDRVYWGQGVRPLSDERFDAIVRVVGTPTAVGLRSAPYASPKVAREVEDFSVAVAVARMKARFGMHVEVMPRNNPGFDLRVGPAGSPTRFVEVKGTQTSDPVFFMSDGERTFSQSHAGLYTLVVVSGIDLQARTHASVTERDGAVDGPDFDLQTAQWRGRVLYPPSSS